MCVIAYIDGGTRAAPGPAHSPRDPCAVVRDVVRVARMGARAVRFWAVWWFRRDAVFGLEVWSVAFGRFRLSVAFG